MPSDCKNTFLFYKFFIKSWIFICTHKYAYAFPALHVRMQIMLFVLSALVLVLMLVEQNWQQAQICRQLPASNALTHIHIYAHIHTYIRTYMQYIRRKQRVMTFALSAKIALLPSNNMRQIIVTMTPLTGFIFIIETVS